MNLSDAGLEFIKNREAYMRARPDGSCQAYQDVIGHKPNGAPILDVPTIGWGCTEGVKMGDVWTREKAEAALRTELGKHEAAIRRLVTVDLSQGKFDSLVSLAFNVGSGNVAKSTLLKYLNAGDYARAASHFADFKKSQGVVLRELVDRRAKEASMFLAGGERQSMPQKVDPPDTKMKPMEALAKVGAPAAVVAGTAGPLIPNVPSSVLETVSNVSAWKSAGNSVLALSPDRAGLMALGAGVLAFAAVRVIGPRLWKGGA